MNFWRWVVTRLSFFDSKTASPCLSLSNAFEFLSLKVNMLQIFISGTNHDEMNSFNNLFPRR